MKELIQNTIQTVNDAFPSIYTKDDVIRLLMSLDLVAPDPITIVAPAPVTTRIIPQNLIDELVERIVSELEDNESELLDVDNVDYDVSVRSDLRLDIEIDGGVTLDQDVATTAVEKAVENWMAEYDIKTEEEAAEETPQERVDQFLSA